MTLRARPAVLMAGCLLVACAGPSVSGSGSPLASGGAPSVESVAPSASPSASAPSGITWTEHSVDVPLASLVVDGDRLVGIGVTADGLAAFTSADGIAWEQQALPHPSFLAEYLEAFQQDPSDPDLVDWSDGYPAEVTALLRLDDTLYAFGTFWGSNDFVRPLGWRLTDGGQWEYIESSSSFFHGCCSLFEMVTDGEALVAVKHQFGAYSGQIWRWASGTGWVETTPGILPSTGTAGAVFSDVTWNGEEFVVVGTKAEVDPATGGDSWPAAAATWSSADGVTWELADPPPTPEGQMRSVVAIPGGGYFAQGCHTCMDGPLPLAWTSADGVAWSSVELPGVFSHVVAANHVLVAVEDADGSTRVWTSSDGISWASDAEFTGSVSAVAASEDRVVLALHTERTATDPPTATVWIGTP